MKNRTAITLFGGSGDLTYRKLLPAMYNLHVLGKLEDNFEIIGLGRRDYTTEDYIAIARNWMKEYSRKQYADETFNEFAKRITYFKIDISNVDEYARLQDFYTSKEISDHVYYYAVAPELFLTITEGLRKYCSQNKAKIIIEKPFGADLDDATKLNSKLEEFFGHDEIYHIDHYLGKEMIQNILSVRFNNAIFKGIWNKDFIESVQITVAEAVGVGTRAGYYDKSGATKDMVQNHLLQVLSIVAMEEPKDSSMDREQLELLKALKPVNKVEDILVMGQYDGYLQENNISENSKTETYVALKVEIENERWQGVPFFIRTGKKMATRESQVIVKFKAENSAPQNMLIIKVQPSEGIYLKFNAKKPGTDKELQEVSMDFCQSCILENRINTPEAYERLLDACFKGDRLLFSKWDQIVVSWNYINNILAKHKAIGSPIYTYEQNTMGPKEADKLTDWILDLE
ncbi:MULTISPECIES: glucose-6-phosphate dehydrogenase [unclassified Gemella]|uniref:glucose-6-phosphate dehydrogenase n=1 Tax=unclassified Gemella TaxID=2624949 RepID=UPI0015D0427A|nr:MULTISPECIES: glucose-6-phosphate dehydrogenase [unclassified Gemella]MBF0709942.1 glucose-6-phosphate dehydrogenase [Gemella sp. GL1.1]NYS27286.1 glucose-6-phosphate dehydrogenase [Gemella sp. GL1]